MRVSDLLLEERESDYIKRLVKTLGIKRLGSGGYSTVFQHPVYHNVAVKLVGADDTMYISFMRSCMKMQDNPWLPKVIGIHQVRIHDSWTNSNIVAADEHLDFANTQWIVFLEKLRAAKLSEIEAGVQQVLSTIPDKYFSGHGGKTFSSRNYYSDFDDFRKKDWTNIAKLSTDKHVCDLAALLTSIGANDLHDGNVMMRNDGQLVITDPVAS